MEISPQDEFRDLVGQVVVLGKLVSLTLIAFFQLVVQGTKLFFTCWLTVFTLLVQVAEKMTKRVSYRTPDSLMML